MSESTGILWNDQMDDFSLPGHPNYFHIPPSKANFIRPGKRPQSSMSPLVVFDPRGGRVLSVGAAGGSTIISGVAGVAMHVLQQGRSLKEAVDFPRLHNQLRPNVTQFEARFPKVGGPRPGTLPGLRVAAGAARAPAGRDAVPDRGHGGAAPRGAGLGEQRLPQGQRERAGRLLTP